MRTRAVVPALVAAVVLAFVAGLVLVLAARGSSTPGATPWRASTAGRWHRSRPVGR